MASVLRRFEDVPLNHPQAAAHLRGVDPRAAAAAETGLAAPERQSRSDRRAITGLSGLSDGGPLLCQHARMNGEVLAHCTAESI